MKKPLHTIITFAIISLSNLVNAQAPNWAWAKSAGGSGEDEAYSVTTDASGNSIVVGYFWSSTISFDTITLTNAGTADIFMVKYDATGTILWAKSAGGIYQDKAYSVTTDVFGNIIVVGFFRSPTISFDTTTLINYNSNGSSDIFIAKLDPSGNVLWAKSEGDSGHDEASTVTIDVSGNIIVAGFFNSPTISFGTITLTDNGGGDLFVVKYDFTGNVLWAKSAGGIYVDEIYSVTSDASGNIIAAGFFNSPTITIGTTTFINNGPNDIIIAKYDSSGNVLWAQSAGGSNSDDGFSVASDASGNVYMTGDFGGLYITFGSTTLTAAGLGDIFIVKYDSGGNVLWAKIAGGIGSDYGNSVATDASGNVFMTGFFSSPTITFGTTTLTNAGTTGINIFITKYDAGGNVVWARSPGGGLSNSVATDVSGNIFITGFFSSPGITFGTTTLTNTGQSDIFVAKLDNTTGLESAGYSNSFSVYPNPANDVLTISNGQSAIGKKVTISITDVTGKLLYNRTSTAIEKMEVNTKDIAAGVYLVQVQTTDFVETRKLIVGR